MAPRLAGQEPSFELASDLRQATLVRVDEQNGASLGLCSCSLRSLASFLSQIEQAHWFYEDFYRKKYGLPKYDQERFVELMFHHCPSLRPYASSVKV